MRKFMALVLVAGLVAACGSSGAAPAAGSAAPAGGTQIALGATDAPTPSPVIADVCALLTTDEAAAALGEPVDPGSAPDPASQSCLFSGNDPAKAQGNAVEVAVTDPADFTAGKTGSDGFTVTPISGLGDDAYFLSSGDQVQLEVIRKGVSLEISVMIDGATADKIQTAEQTVAKLVIGRI